jgi:hypothetical protein
MTDRLTISVKNAAALPIFWKIEVTPDSDEARAIGARIQKACRRAVLAAWREASE